MDIKELFKMQDAVRAFVLQDDHPNLRLSAALDVTMAAITWLPKDSARVVLAEAIKRLEKKLDSD